MLNTVNLGNLLEPDNDKSRADCEKAQEYLSSEWDQWPLPSAVEIKGNTALVWFIYKDTWPFDVEPDFKYSVAIPAYLFWGKKKRDKYLRKQKEEIAAVYAGNLNRSEDNGED